MSIDNKRIAHCIPHTHWDPFWYFTAQDSMVTFAYNMKEMLRAFESGELQYFFLDGQTVAIDEYLEIHPEDRDQITKFVKAKKLIIGPFNSQLDCFITCGESIINNLKIGIENANALGGSSKIAYLADPFGQSYDFPKIFNQMGIQDFVFTRGINDAYGLGIDFFFTSNDGSKVLAHSLLSGYGYGAYAFKDGTLFTSDALDYNKIDVQSLIDRLLDRSVLKNEFVFPLGFDQNPIMKDMDKKIKFYNEKFPTYYFKLTTWENYLKHVRDDGVDLKTFNQEIMGAQYHRIHKSGMNSARADIKSIQDKAERVLTFESQPIMTMLDSLGIPYDKDILRKAWYTLVNCQTHASATHMDDTNAYIKNNSKEALSIAIAIKVYLMRLVAASLPSVKNQVPLVVFRSIPTKKRAIEKLIIITKKKSFVLWHHDQKLDYIVLDVKKENAGVVRKNKVDMSDNECFYKTSIMVDLGELHGISYTTLYVEELDSLDVLVPEKAVHSTDYFIENEYFHIELSKQGLMIKDKISGRVFNRAIYLEDGGDAGDNYDYDYPDEGTDWILHHHFEHASTTSHKCKYRNEMILQGTFLIPSNLEERRTKKRSSLLEYEITFRLSEDKNLIEIKGTIHNKAYDHRLRIVMDTNLHNTVSFAGTQFGYVQRDCNPSELKSWRKDRWFEEPSTTNPLLNHVSAVGDEQVYSIFTRGPKEYDFINQNCSDIAITLFRAVGWLGLPDLNRRPGRPSGLANKVFKTPDSQMLGNHSFELGITMYSTYNGNVIMNDYIDYACEAMYYQNQSIDKTVFPISYFPINPCTKTLPLDYDFVQLKDSKASFGTMVKAKDEQGYILRIYNSEYHEIHGGELNLGFHTLNTCTCDLLDEHLQPLDRGALDLRKGELRNLYLKTNIKP